MRSVSQARHKYILSICNVGIWVELAKTVAIDSGKFVLICLLYFYTGFLKKIKSAEHPFQS